MDCSIFHLSLPPPTFCRSSCLHFFTITLSVCRCFSCLLFCLFLCYLSIISPLPSLLPFNSSVSDTSVSIYNPHHTATTPCTNSWLFSHILSSSLRSDCCRPCCRVKAPLPSPHHSRAGTGSGTGSGTASPIQVSGAKPVSSVTTHTTHTTHTQ
ncbi:hypothetical protein BO99DRAFT_24110 [Aspergillus violaceofuscus CBS 115571]|uniref:Uncharacterized protein n=1 Tax=Aspergillus violaceofuscus (strain CBS 115571) TaxID=1450538 RepID=A0A2V5HR23_ASPV1|nr:hypothetical protein BO99DRAFT_24110 [Aspergillus violaceofuscus CBS 115571]